MKRILILALLVAPFVLSTSVYAQTVATTASTTTASIADPGLTPDSSFYFLDKFVESLQDFFTFNPDAKAKLQIQFAAERVAEIKIMIKSGGVNDPGITEAQTRLQEHTKKADEIIKQEKGSGKDVAELEAELNDSITNNDQELEDTIQNAEQDLESQKNDLEQQINQAEKAGDKAKIQELKQQIKDAEKNTEDIKKQTENTREMLKRDSQGEDNQNNQGEQNNSGENNQGSDN